MDEKENVQPMSRLFKLTQYKPLAQLCLYGYNLWMKQRIKNLFWIGSAKKDLMAMPVGVQEIFGYALHQAQSGKKHEQAKPLNGFGSAGVVEVVDHSGGGTFRAVYTVKFNDTVYILHCFQKKSSQGISTPKPDMDLIRERLKAAEIHAKGELKWSRLKQVLETFMQI